MLLEHPDDYTGIDHWAHARDIVPELAVNPSTIGWVSTDPRSGGDGHRLTPAEFAILLDLDGTHVAIIGRPAELMNLAKQIQGDLRDLQGMLTVKARAANTWCMWCQQPIEHIRHPEAESTLGPPDWWQHIVTCETACGNAYVTEKREAAPLLDIHPCQHCHEPVAQVLNSPAGERGQINRWWWHIRNKIKACDILDPNPTQARPALGEQWTPRPTIDLTTDPWAEKETDDL